MFRIMGKVTLSLSFFLYQVTMSKVNRCNCSVRIFGSLSSLDPLLAVTFYKHPEQ